MGSVRAVLIWASLAAAVAIPIVIAVMSPLLAWRDAIYIASGFAGMVAMALLLIQPLLVAGSLPGLPPRHGRQLHRWVGIVLVFMVLGHVAGLWITSAPDVVDALMFDSPTPFSPWGVVAMWATFSAALLAAFRRRLRISTQVWRVGHTMLAVVIVVGSVVHALLVEGTMGQVSKVAFCGLVLVSLTKVVMDMRAWSLLMRRRGPAKRP